MIAPKDIPDARLTDPTPIPPEIRRTAELAYDFALDRRNPFPKRVKAFLTGESKLGRTAGIILDVATIFLPGAVRDGREAVQRILQRKSKPMLLKDKPLHESKTFWGAVLFVLFGILRSA